MAKPHGPLERLLHAPNLPAIVPRLEPEILQRLIQTCGLEDSAQLLVHATPEQIGRVMDSDIWRAPGPGFDEAFDPDRFGLWLTVLMQSDSTMASGKLAGLEIELMVAGIASHIAVFDYVAAAAYTTLDGEQMPGRRTPDGLTCEIGGYLVEARRSSAWDAIVDLLVLLESERPDYFHRLMRACVRLSNGALEQDGFHDLLDARGQDLLDLSLDREARREERGYMSPAQARAFLIETRNFRFDAERPAGSAIARAYFRAIEPVSLPPREAAVHPDVSTVIELLEHAGVPAGRPRALLGASDTPRSSLPFVHAYAASHPAGEEELAYLANTILAGCSVQGRSLTVQEAPDCVLAICNLGLEHWPSHWPAGDLITAFQVGWAILHRDVCLYAARRLTDVLAVIRCSDRDTQLQLDGLRRGLVRHLDDGEPWRAGDALDVILVLDSACWAALRALIDECPVMHAALDASRRACRTIDPADFQFISDSRQIASVRQFLDALPSLLTA
jgi:hypothetical protein